MFESLERRCLFSFGFEPIIPPPVDVADAVHAGRAPELIAPVPATHEKLLIELPAAQFKSLDSHRRRGRGSPTGQASGAAAGLHGAAA